MLARLGALDLRFSRSLHCFAADSKTDSRQTFVEKMQRNPQNPWDEYAVQMKRLESKNKRAAWIRADPLPSAALLQPIERHKGTTENAVIQSKMGSFSTPDSASMSLSFGVATGQPTWRVTNLGRHGAGLLAQSAE